jgi:hypothetical protein
MTARLSVATKISEACAFRRAHFARPSHAALWMILAWLQSAA